MLVYIYTLCTVYVRYGYGGVNVCTGTVADDYKKW